MPVKEKLSQMKVKSEQQKKEPEKTIDRFAIIGMIRVADRSGLLRNANDFH